MDGGGWGLAWRIMQHEADRSGRELHSQSAALLLCHTNNKAFLSLFVCVCARASDEWFDWLGMGGGGGLCIEGGSRRGLV